ncbi:MAG: ABC transporter ATP-binding protein [Anaerolineales bacterium]|jgi:ABC-2 type transport system ATP-binding protein
MPSSPEVVIQVDSISKAFGSLKAVDALSFEVYRGEIFGLLGPNGAGKTTTLTIIEGLRTADEGSVVVLGMDVSTDPLAVKARLGVQLQATSLLPDLEAIEQVMLFSRLYGMRFDRSKASNLLARFGLEDKSRSRPGTLSGGQKKRLAIALALVNDPEIILLDEPTTGLDPQSRRMLWGFVRDLQAQGRTIVLTTHYMEEAEALCNRVGIIDHGGLLALDTPVHLIDELEGLSTISTVAPISLESVREIPGVVDVNHEGEEIHVQSRDVVRTLEGLLDQSKRLGVSLGNLHINQPSLEDVFLQLTGRTIRD